MFYVYFKPPPPIFEHRSISSCFHAEEEESPLLNFAFQRKPSKKNVKMNSSCSSKFECAKIKANRKYLVDTKEMRNLQFVDV